MEYEYLLEVFPQGELLAKRMFGGIAYYYRGKMVLVVMQGPGEKTYRGKTYKFDIWHGLLFPLEWEEHAFIVSKYPTLFSHPVLGKWLYLPFDTESFEEIAESIMLDIRRGSAQPGHGEWGIWPKPKKSTKSKKFKKPKHRR